MANTKSKSADAVPKTITASRLAEQLWTLVVENDMFDEKLAPVQEALKDFIADNLVGTTIVAG